ARAGDGHGEYGRTQVRRIRADAHLPRPLRREDGDTCARDGEGLTDMSKKSAPRRVGETEARAYSRSIRVSPRKLNLLAQSIRGKTAEAALAQLAFSPKRI